jgi:nucleotide-binding universal stress UspA family protein
MLEPMTASAHPVPRIRRPIGQRRSGATVQGRRPAEQDTAPIVVAIDDSSASATAIRDAVRVTRALRAPVIFVYVRRDPSSRLGEPYYQRRLDAVMATGRSVLRDALEVAAQAGVPATGEVLEGDPARRVLEFARMRDARLVVLGSRRRRLRSVSRRVIRSADRPVVIAGRTVPGADLWSAA